MNYRPSLRKCDGTAARVTFLIGLLWVSSLQLPLCAQECLSGSVHRHHDDHFEDFRYYLTAEQPPPWGALGEGFDLGSGVIETGVFWVASSGGPPEFADLYVWSGGVTREPGDVLLHIPDLVLDYTMSWPDEWWGVADYPLNLEVEGEFTLGLWAQWAPNDYPMCPADTTGPGGHPWILIPTNYPWPEGWQDPSIMGSTVQSLGFGVCFHGTVSDVDIDFDTNEETNTEERPDRRVTTWGQIKKQFRK